jgi:DNA processing protein
MDFQQVKLKDRKYPELLSEINNPPKAIYVLGDLPEDDSPTIAIVGTRKASKKGLELARWSAQEFVRTGVVVISGLAMGVDTAAHRGALDGNGKTIAVLGNGIDKIYPAQNEKLAEEILKNGGAIISEYGPGEPSYKGNFIQRNRIISGLSSGIVIIEAPSQSGALATAGFGAEQGRSVFVFPGSATDKNYAGSHALIRDGAILVTSPREALEDMGLKHILDASKSRELNKKEKMIVDALKSAGSPLSIDRIRELTKLDAQVVSSTIAILVIEGIIQETGSGYEFSHS